MKPLILAIAAVGLLAAPAASQTKIKIDKPRVNVGDVNSNSTSRAEQRVTGVDANVQTYFEASDIPANTRSNATVKNVPDAVAPSIVGGNPCMVSASIGGSGVGFGFGVGLGVEDEGCETRQVVALMSNMGDRQAAFLHLCMHNAQVMETVKAAGFATCQAYAGIITPGAARVPGAAVATQVSTPGVATPPVVIQTRPVSTGGAATSMTMVTADARDCGDREYRDLQRDGAAWSAYSAACQARHTQR